MCGFSFHFIDYEKQLFINVAQIMALKTTKGVRNCFTALKYTPERNDSET